MWWNSVRDLLEYAKSEKPDPYEVVRMANKIASEWNEQKPPSTNDPTVQWWDGITYAGGPSNYAGSQDL